MNDVAVVKEGWLHKRGQCPRGQPGRGPEPACGPLGGRCGLGQGRGWVGPPLAPDLVWVGFQARRPHDLEGTASRDLWGGGWGAASPACSLAGGRWCGRLAGAEGRESFPGRQ